MSDFKLLRIFMAGRLPRSFNFLLFGAVQGPAAHLERARFQVKALPFGHFDPPSAVVGPVALNVILFLAGVVLAWLTLRDVFETVVVPGGSRASLRVTSRIGRILLTSTSSFAASGSASPAPLPRWCS